MLIEDNIIATTSILNQGSLTYQKWMLRNKHISSNYAFKLAVPTLVDGKRTEMVGRLPKSLVCKSSSSRRNQPWSILLFNELKWHTWMIINNIEPQIHLFFAIISISPGFFQLSHFFPKFFAWHIQSLRHNRPDFIQPPCWSAFIVIRLCSRHIRFM